MYNTIIPVEPGWKAYYLDTKGDVVIRPVACLGLTPEGGLPNTGGIVKAVIMNDDSIFTDADKEPRFIGITRPGEMFGGRLDRQKVEVVTAMLESQFDYIDPEIIRPIVIEHDGIYTSSWQALLEEEITVLHTMLSELMEYPPSREEVEAWDEELFRKAGEWATIRAIFNTGQEPELSDSDVLMPEFLQEFEDAARPHS